MATSQAFSSDGVAMHCGCSRTPASATAQQKERRLSAVVLVHEHNKTEGNKQKEGFTSSQTEFGFHRSGGRGTIFAEPIVLRNLPKCKTKSLRIGWRGERTEVKPTQEMWKVAEQSPPSQHINCPRFGVSPNLFSK